MSQHAPDWQWDAAARLWYCFNPQLGCEVFENGTRRSRAQQPRQLPTGSRDPPSVGQYATNPTPQHNTYNISAGGSAALAGNVSASGTGNAGKAPLHDRPPARQDRATTLETLTHDFAKKTQVNPNPRTPLKYEQREWTDRNGDQFLEVKNPLSEVQTTLKLGPPKRITDPALFEKGIKATQMLMPTKGETEKLFDEYRRREQPRRFFTRGKVFRVLWSEPAGPDHRTAVTFEAPGVSTGKFGERVFSKVRLFVVIREGDNYCSALPIVSYGGQGVSKRGVTKSDYSVIYSGKVAPEPCEDEAPLRGEQGMRPDAIRVNPDDRADGLAPRSRIDYGKVYTIEHNIKVKPYGQVHPASEAALRHQFLNVWLGEAAAGAVARSSDDSATSNAPAPVRSTTRRRRESEATQNVTSGDPRPREGSTAAVDPREVSARAAVQRLMQSGRTHEQAIELVRAHARQQQQQQQAANRAPSLAADDGSDGDDGDSSADDSDDGSRVRASSRSRGETRASRSTGSGQQRQHPPRVDSRPREAVPPRQSGASLPQTTVTVQPRRDPPSYGTGTPQEPRPGQARQGPSHSTGAPGHSHGQQSSQRSQQQQQLPTSTSAQEVVQRLIDRGYTREQALQYVAASLARQRNV